MAQLPRPRLFAAVVLAAAVLAAACGSDDDTDRAALSGQEAEPETTVSAPSVPGIPGLPSQAQPLPETDVSETPDGEVALAVTEVATGLDTPWALAFDRRDSSLWFTERPGRVTRLGGQPENIPGVVEVGESGLLGMVFDGAGKRWLYYTTATDNRIVRYDAEGPKVIVSGIERAAIHDGGRLALGPDGAVYAGTGDASRQDSAQEDGSHNGKILRIDSGTGAVENHSKGHRNVQGLCFTNLGSFLQTEHGPDHGDEINRITQGMNGGWPGTAGNGIKNWTPTIAPAGCAVYDDPLIPAWNGSMLLVTLKEQDLRRITFNDDGSFAGEEILFDGAFGRLRDVKVGPDGAVYVATSNNDGRGRPAANDDRILRIAPSGK